MEEKSNIENFDWELIAKYLNKETNSREDSQIKDWLKQSDDNLREMEKIRQMLIKVDGYYKVRNFDLGNAWKNVNSKINPSQLKVIQRKKERKEAIAQFYKYAAIIVVAILLGSIGYYFGFRNQVPAIYSEIVSAEKQVLNEYVLPDGSVVALNSKSKLEFPKQFADDIREVTITGEAFFDVTPNPEKPFVINAGGAKVKVLGTSFNVCAYPGSETVEVVVKTGKVQVINSNENLPLENREVFLNPGDKGTLFNESNILEKSVNADMNFLAWKTNNIIFNETPLSEVVRCLEKVYFIDIHLADKELENEKLTATFDQKPVDFVLDVVRLTFNLELTEKNEHFILSSRNNIQE